MNDISTISHTQRKVLITDDDPFNILTHEKLFNQLGLQTCSAYSGQQAIELITQNPWEYGLILMDCSMPIMDGIEVILFCYIIYRPLVILEKFLNSQKLTIFYI